MIKFKLDIKKAEDQLAGFILKQKNIFKRLRTEAVQKVLKELGDKIVENMTNNVEYQKTGCAMDYNAGTLVGDGYLDSNEASTLIYKSSHRYGNRTLIEADGFLADEFYYDIKIESGKFLTVELTEGAIGSRRFKTPKEQFRLSVHQGDERGKNYELVNPALDPKFPDVVSKFLKQRILQEYNNLKKR